ncbi:MAG: flagellar basal body P-ring protein FlgI [Planctomycetota bacterium]|nr:flagellar basal body P-ring protein FlgI [Planctomycetota bacterium]
MTRHGRTKSRLGLSAILFLGGMLLAGGSGCANQGKNRQVERVDITPRAVPAPLRGTVGSLAQSSAGEPMIISGFGLVVGLNGTGGGLLDERIAATMEREMQLQGVGLGSNVEGTALEDPVLRRPKTAGELLRDPNVAVVLVQAVIPRGSPDGYPFDVYVQAMNASSLEGGQLWTTTLRLGPPGVFGGIQTREIGKAVGEVFINPFEDPSDTLGAEVRTVGRVLAGGEVSNAMPIQIRLDTPSHQRARQIAFAVNSRFPNRAQVREPAARGFDDSLIQLHVPPAYTSRPNEFLRIVEHLPIDRTFPQERARTYTAALESSPELRESMMWCLVALGDPSLPFIRELYDHRDTAVRMAALRTGSFLDDVRAAPALLEIAGIGSAAERNEAIALLGEIDGGPTVDIGLRELIKNSALTTRIAAYEALARRAERAEYSRLLMIEARRPDSSGMARTPRELSIISRARIPASALQGIQRATIPGKFVLDVVPYGEPLVYVTQQGTPRVVLFGGELELVRPMLASAWDDRFMVIADSAAETPRLRYENYRNGLVRIEQVSPSLPDLIVFMATDPRPEDRVPGLGMSYSEVVGALHALYDAGATRAAFATETDKLMAELVEAARTGQVLERPETLADRDKPTESDDGLVVDVSYLKAERARKPQVVPLAPKDSKK